MAPPRLDIRIPSHGEQLAAYLYRPDDAAGDIEHPATISSGANRQADAQPVLGGATLHLDDFAVRQINLA